MNEQLLNALNSHEIKDGWLEGNEYKALCKCGAIFPDIAVEMYDHLKTVFFGE